MPFIHIVVALMLLVCAVAISACHPPTPKVVERMAASFIETSPLAAVNWPAYVFQAERLTRLPGLMESRG